ncbi:MAG: FAD-dependent oxidoreductase [Minisyncoccia bacterium]
MHERITHARVAIAGGGPAGVMLGYLLARAGIVCTVLEKWPDFFRDFRGDTIHPSTMEILHELGLLDEFLKLPHNEMTRMTIRANDREATIADLSRLRARTPYIAFIPQWDFLNFLSAKARAFPAFHLMMETEAVDLLREGQTVVGLRAKDAQGEFELRAELVVGADGRHSTVREKGSFEVEELGVPIDVLWFRIGRGDADDKQSLGYLAAGGALVMLDRHDYWQCAFVIRKGGFDRIKLEGLDAFRTAIAALAHIPESAVAEVDSWDKVKLLSASVDHAQQWVKDGALIVGDAAHAMSPLGGVGINYAIGDAVAAANVLIPALRKGTLSGETLARVQARRERSVRRMQKIQVFVQDRLLSPLISGKRAVRMPWFFTLFNVLPMLRRLPAHIIGIGFGPEHIEITF